MVGTLEAVVVAFWAMLPAYVPNNAAVLFGGGTPIDGGRTWNGRRVLGDGKTWRGVAAGTLVGVAVAVGLSTVAPRVSEAAGFVLPAFPPVAAVTMAAGAMLGDVVASFLKRRTGRARGRPFPGVDQLDFVVGALGLTALSSPGWFIDTFLEPPLVAVVVVVITPALHLLTNFLAYRMDLKSEPY